MPEPRYSKRFSPSSITKILVPIVLVMLIVLLLAVLIIVGLSLLGGTPSA